MEVVSYAFIMDQSNKNDVSGFVNYLANESSYIVSVLEEDTLGEGVHTAEEQALLLFMKLAGKRKL